MRKFSPLYLLHLLPGLVSCAVRNKFDRQIACDSQKGPPTSISPDWAYLYATYRANTKDETINYIIFK